MTHKIECIRCQMQIWLTDEFYVVAKQTEQVFYCPAGHGQHFPLGPTEADKLRTERDRLAQKIAEKDDEIKAAWATANQQAEWRKDAERKVAAARGQITKLKKRASNGVCPCCGRTFSDLARHMHTKHPAFLQKPTADEHIN